MQRIILAASFALSLSACAHNRPTRVGCPDPTRIEIPSVLVAAPSSNGGIGGMMGLAPHYQWTKASYRYECPEPKRG